MDDTALVQAVAKGDKGALRMLYERHHKPILRLAFRYVGDEEDARDIVQEIFVELFQKARYYREQGKFSTWLYRLTVNRCINHQRSAYRRLREYDEGESILKRTLSSELGAEHQMIVQERQRHLHLALKELPERQRMAIILSRFEGLSYRKIAEVMNLSESSVSSLLFRAKNNLKKLLLERGS